MSAECHRAQAATGMITLCISSSSRGFKGLLDKVANSCDDGTPDGVGLAPKVGGQQADVAGHNMRQPAGFKVTHSDTTPWVARYNAWLLIESMPKGTVFCFLFFSSEATAAQPGT